MREFVKAGGTRFTEHDIRGKVATDIDDPYQAQSSWRTRRSKSQNITSSSARKQSFNLIQERKVMNIDYGQILKNATARQQALELLEAELSQVDVIRMHLDAAEARATGLINAYKALDQEGRSLLGPLNTSIDYVEVHLSKIKSAKGLFETMARQSAAKES